MAQNDGIGYSQMKEDKFDPSNKTSAQILHQSGHQAVP
jgi:hypothetical protein